MIWFNNISVRGLKPAGAQPADSEIDIMHSQDYSHLLKSKVAQRRPLLQLFLNLWERKKVSKTAEFDP